MVFQNTYHGMHCTQLQPVSVSVSACVVQYLSVLLSQFPLLTVTYSTCIGNGGAAQARTFSVSRTVSQEKNQR